MHGRVHPRRHTHAHWPLRRRPLPGTPIIALRVASEPVPAVVGTAMKGNGSALSGFPPPTPSRYSSRSGGGAGSNAAIALPGSSAEPPPIATTASGAKVRPRARAASSVSRSGSRLPPELRAPVASSASISGAAHAGDRPCTIRSHRPNARISAALAIASPAPKRTRAGRIRPNGAISVAGIAFKGLGRPSIHAACRPCPGERAHCLRLRQDAA